MGEVSTEDILKDLQRLDEDDRCKSPPSANDVKRHGAYTLNTYYVRFNKYGVTWSWSKVTETYLQWRDTGEIPKIGPDDEPVWKQLQRERGNWEGP